MIYRYVEEVRRQFHEILGLMKGKATQEYARCVDVATANALRKMLVSTVTMLEEVLAEMSYG